MTIRFLVLYEDRTNIICMITSYEHNSFCMQRNPQPPPPYTCPPPLPRPLYLHQFTKQEPINFHKTSHPHLQNVRDTHKNTHAKPTKIVKHNAQSKKFQKGESPAKQDNHLRFTGRHTVNTQFTRGQNYSSSMKGIT